MRKHAGRTAGAEGRADSSSLAAEAYGIVRHRILSGALHLGQTISRRTIAQELGMSRREAVAPKRRSPLRRTRRLEADAA